MNNQELDELCRKIYKNHRLALDLIWDRVGSPGSASLVEVVNILDQDARWYVLHRSGHYVDFMPQAWLEWLKPVTQDSYPFCIQIRSREAGIDYKLWIGPMQDAAKRTRVVTKLREKAPVVGFKRSRALQVDDDWNRISAAETIVKLGDDDEPEPAAIREGVKKFLDELFVKLEKLAPILKESVK